MEKYNILAYIHILPNEVLQFMEQHNILNFKDSLKYTLLSLIKYEDGYFFLNHLDTNMSNHICIKINILV